MHFLGERVALCPPPSFLGYDDTQPMYVAILHSDILIHI